MGDKAKTKQESVLPSQSLPTTSKKQASTLVFQQLCSTSIEPQAKTETKIEKPEPLITKSEPRYAAHEIIVIDSDDDSFIHREPPISRVKDKKDVRSSGTPDVSRSTKATSKRVDPNAGNAVTSAPSGEMTADGQEGSHMKSSLGTFLRLISSSAQGEGSYSSLLQTANKTYKRAEEVQNGTQQDNQASSLNAPANVGKTDGHPQENSHPASAGTREDGQQKHSPKQVELQHHQGLSRAPRVDDARPHSRNDQCASPNAVRCEATEEIRPSFATDFPSDWFHESSDGGGESSFENLQEGSQNAEEVEKNAPVTTTNDGKSNVRASKPDSDTRRWSSSPAKERRAKLSRLIRLEDEGRQASSCNSDPLAKEELHTTSEMHRTRRETSLPRGEPYFLQLRNETEDIITPAPTSRRRTDVQNGFTHDAESGSARSQEQRRKKVWRKKYYLVDVKRSTAQKRRRIEISHSPSDCGSRELDKRVKSEVLLESESDAESDADPDELELTPRSPSRRFSQRNSIIENDRRKRALRRAAEAEGNPVHWSLMVDRKPAIKENNENVIIKVRETRGRILYTFVKPRWVEFRDLREELELLAKLPTNMKFELLYRKVVLKDSDSPESLGIQHSARIKARRREKDAGDSSDSVTEVERTRRRAKLLKVAVRDEKGKEHEFQHNREEKFGSMFRAFAKLCDNDVRSYRFFYDGKRLSDEDSPVDCEDFEEGAVIDAFFEAQGGTDR